MTLLNLDKLCASAEACLGWPYVSPGTNDSRGIDCSGLLVKCFRDQGGSIYHGSNTIYRKYLSKRGQIAGLFSIKRGMAVFKWNPNTPEKFSDGLGDFQHVGLVTSVNPLRIVHASSATGSVTVDTTLGKWAYWGWLKDVEEPGDTNPGTTVTETNQGGDKQSGVQIRIASGGGKVNLRRGNGMDYSRVTSVAPDTLLEWVATAVNGWHAVKYGKQVVWVSPEYSKLE